MILKSNEYVINEFDSIKTITITKTALEKWRLYYAKASDGEVDKNIESYYAGMADLLADMLKHFTKEDKK